MIGRTLFQGLFHARPSENRAFGDNLLLLTHIGAC